MSSCIDFLELPGSWLLVALVNMSAALKTDILSESPTFRTNSEKTFSVIFLIVVANDKFLLTLLGTLLPQNHDLCSA